MHADIIHSFVKNQTYDNRDLPVRLRKRIGACAVVSGPYDQSAVHGSPEEGVVSVPPQGAYLPGDVKPVGELVVGRDGALGDHRHPVVPTV